MGLTVLPCRRNVRLRKGFVNTEKAAFGGLKLKIPTLLFVEKMRTQTRFNVSARPRRAFCVEIHSVLKLGRAQLMRSSMGPDPPPPGSPSGLAKDAMAVERGKTSHNASSKVNLVVQKMLFPMLDAPMRTHVLLDSEADQAELDLLDQVGRQNPGLLEDQQSFLAHLQSLLERYRRRCHGPSYERVSTSCARTPDPSLHPRRPNPPS